MPKPTRYVAKDGTATYRVRFRHGGIETSETFATRERAATFCVDIADVGVDEALRLLEEEHKDGGDMPLDELAALFFEWKAGHVRSDRSVADYERDYRNWISPTFGRRRAAGVSSRSVQRWVDAMRDGLLDGKKPAAPKSIGDRHALLHGILDHGKALHIVTVNPCEGTDLPKKQRGLPKGMRPAEWQALAVALRQVDPDAADLAEFLLATGWRWSEASGITVAQVEDNGVDVYVHMDRVRRRNAAGKVVVVEEGKGQASIRRTSLAHGAAVMVRARCAGRPLDALVFTTKGGNVWGQSNFRQRKWDIACKAAGLSRKPTPHWLRHTHVVWMAMSGASLPELQSRIGHASIKTTIDVYGRMLTDVQPSTLSAFEAMSGGSGLVIERA